MKKIISVLLVAVFFVTSFSFSVSALTTTENFTGYVEPVRYASTNRAVQGKDILDKVVDIKSFKSTILSGVSKCSDSINISRYNIEYKDLYTNAIMDYIWYNMPEAFSANSLGFSYSGKTITAVHPLYYSFADTATEYSNCYSKMVAGGDRLLAGIEGNDALTDIQKALLLHDRLALWNEYDYDRLATMDDEIFTAYGALGERRSVCQGYAMAYMYLLDRVGIKNHYCSSEALYHGWNIVYIDNKPYHVDVTWDDIDWGTGKNSGIAGAVGHTNFLRSSSGIYATGHEAFDYDYSPVDTTYDEYFWQSSEASFELIDDEIYYIDSDSAQIKRYSDKGAIYTFDVSWCHWLDDSRWHDFGNCASLTNDGNALIYSLPNGVYRFDVNTHKSTQIYDAKLNGNLSIYGMTLEDGFIICDINEAPPYYKGFNYDNTYRVKFKYEMAQPELIGIEISNLPDKIEYVVGEEFDSNGLTVNLVYSDGTKKTITEGFNISSFDSSVTGSKTVIVSYDRFNTTFVVNVYNKSGDTNGDGKINVKDYAVLIQYLNGWNVELDEAAADVNADEKINVKDYALLIQYLNGWNVELK